MRKRSRTTLGLTLAAAGAVLLLLLQWKLEFHWGSPALAKEQRPSAVTGTFARQGTSSAAPDSPGLISEMASAAERLTARILRESERVGSTTNDPEKVEQILNEWAQKLTDEDLVQIREIVFETFRDGDEAALSLDLLGRSPSPLAAEILTDYILQGPSAPTNEKSTFQLLALDGLIDHSMNSQNPGYLQRVRNQTDDSLVARRATQALQAMRGRALKPSQSDEAALRSLIEKRSN